MDIAIHSLLEGTSRAIGTVAVIDVFRAFTTAAVALANGAARIIMVGAVDEALALRNAGIGQVCMGEVRGRAPDDSISEIHPSRSARSTSSARPSSRGPAPALRGSFQRQDKQSVSTQPRS
jgi:hypothetical protein